MLIGNAMQSEYNAAMQSSSLLSWAKSMIFAENVFIWNSSTATSVLENVMMRFFSNISQNFSAGHASSMIY